MARRRHPRTETRQRNGAKTPSHRSAASDAVERLYRDRNGNLRDPRRFDRREHPWKRVVIGSGLIALALLAVAAWASFVVFRPTSSTRTGRIAITIDAPPIAQLGDAVAYRVTVANEGRVPITSTTVELVLPDGYLLASAEPQPDAGQRTRWTIGTIEGNASNTIELRGHLYGEPGTPARIAATAIYRPGNFNANFEERTEATTALGASPVTLALEGPKTTVPGEEVTYTITYAHVAGQPSTDIAITLEIPQTFAITSTEPVRDDARESTWNIAALTGDMTGTVTVHGRFLSGDEAHLRARATVTPQGHAITIASANAETDVIGGDVLLLATANDQTNGFTVSSGESLRFRIAMRNDGDTTVRNLTVRAILDASSVAERSILNFNAIEDGANGTVTGEQRAAGLRRGTIVWTPANVPALTELAPGAQATINFTIPLHTAASLPGLPKTGRIQLDVQTEIGATGTLDKPYTIQTTPIVITVQ
ncbi:MAG: hypothetical protein Q7S96_01380 [bacterium]|nr:hypothetical protein [bacterium]